MNKTLFIVAGRYGVACGILAFVLLLVMYYIGSHPLLIPPFLDFRILLFGIFTFFTLKEIRDYHQKGILYFWQAMAGALTVVLVAATITSCLLGLFGIWEKDFVASYITELTVFLQSFPKEDIDRIGKDVFDRNLKELPATNVFDLAQTYFMQGMAVGFFVSIIVSVILRRLPKP